MAKQEQGQKPEHKHSDKCYYMQLTCSKREHTHDVGCRDLNGNLDCHMPAHRHGKGCYTRQTDCGFS